METVLFPIVLSLILVESILSGRWKRFYFEYGLPLFQKNIFLNESFLEVSIVVEKMNHKFKSSGYSPSLYFRAIDENTIAFREKMFELSLFTYTPLMHGRISLSQNNQNIKITGLSNWFPLAFLFLWYYSLLPNVSIQKDLIFLLAPILIFGVIYIIQRNKYQTLCTYLADIKC
ncbi:MAG: hypothetical protein ACD_20C00307G0002 [uncultured bacterium]|nr:MAG: hypothetical protein ACD_20C00307G0002 [uncultured bacterium]